MSGKRGSNFRAGDRSEYLAAYGLSRIAFVHPAPRPEDFGVIDFLCILTRAEGGNAYPESAFYVQVKSADDPVVFDADAIRWISHHMDHPLLLCIADKHGGKLTFYSCSRIWFALFLQAEPASVMLIPDSNSPPGHIEPSEDPGIPADFKVHLGPPILRQELSELEQNPQLAYSVLEPWIRVDAANIGRRRVGRIAVSCIENWTTNQSPGTDRYVQYYFGPNFPDAERDLVPVLTALAHNYRHNRLRKRLDAVCELLAELGPLLDEHGRKFLDGRLRIDD